MKRIMIITAMLAAISLSLQAGPKVEMKTSGPSGQGDLIWWAPSTGVTNLRMTVNGLTEVTLYETPTIYDLTLLGDLDVTSNAMVGATMTAEDVIATDDLNVGDDATITGSVTVVSLTASKPVFTDGSKALTSSGTLAVDQGGSGVATLTDHGVLVGSGTEAITPLAVGTDGQLLVGASSADPAWVTVGGAFTMAAGGTSTLIGNIAQARITNALVDAIGPDQMADADHGDVAWSSGVASVQEINSVAVATVTAGAAAGATALQPNTVVTTGVTNGVDTAVITVTNGLDAASTIVGIWSATLNGAASDANLTSIAATTGTLLSAADSPTIVVVTDSSGYAALTVTVSAASTNYVAFIQNNGVRKSSAEMVFDGP